MNNYAILQFVGMFLLGLGAISGIALFFKSLSEKDAVTKGPGVSTLWGLFIIGMTAGIIIIISVRF